MNNKQHFIGLWEEARTRYSNFLTDLREDELAKTLAPSPNSAGFLIRHISDVELLFAKNVFMAEGIQVHAKTLIDHKDSGQWTNLQELIDYNQKAHDSLRAAILAQDDQEWEKQISTKEFGTKTKAEALGRIISHTAYHAGQLAIILKYGH